MRGFFAVCALVLGVALLAACAAVGGLGSYSTGECAGGCDASVPSDATAGHVDAGHDAGRDAPRVHPHHDAMPDVQPVSADARHDVAPIMGDSGLHCIIDGTQYLPGVANPANPCEGCQPATSMSVWSNFADGTSCGSGQICGGGRCGTQCDIDHKVYAPNAPNPSNPCESCQPGASTSVWTDLTDGTACGSGQICSAGHCGSQCDIGGAVYAPDKANPANACQSCQPGTSASAWSSVANGTDCGAGQVCANGQCGEQCDIGGTLYAASSVDPSNPCQTCQSATSTSAWTNLPNGTTCGAGEVCTSGTCGSGCFISGTQYAAAAPNPMNACQACTPATTTSAWTSVADGTGCGTAQVCSAGTCSSGCEIAGVYFAATVVNPNDACQSCQPASATASWTNLSDGTSCGNAQVCASGQCGTQCDIGGQIYGSSATNPMNPCQSCQPGSSTSMWNNLSDGSTCGSGEVCSMGTCGAGCFIGGTIYPSATPDPSNACQGCVPLTSTSVWSNVKDGNPCGSGGLCYSGTCVSGCEIGDVYYTAAAPNPSNSCQSCQPGTSVTGWSNIPDGTDCGNGLICTDGLCGSVCDIAGTVYQSGASNPANACQTCQPGTSNSAWTNLVDGATCGAGEVCSAVTCLAGCYVGGTYYPTATPNPALVCQSCQPSASTSSWTNVAVGTSCATGQVCNGSTCGPGCFIGTAYYSPSAANPGNACQSCQPTVSTTGWTDANGVNPSCNADAVCNGGGCQEGCFINGVYYPGADTDGGPADAAAAEEPSNPCQSCQPDVSNSGWTNVADGTGCGNSQICAGGQCGTQCDIGGIVYPVATINQNNTCESCQPAESTSQWSNLADGAGCATGEVCASGNCVAECFIGGMLDTSGTLSPGNPCQSCQPGASVGGWTNVVDGTGCGAGDVCTQGNCEAGCVIGGTFYAPTTPNPANTCQICQPSSSTTGWSNLPDWTVCGSAEVCQGGTCYPECTVVETSMISETSPYAVGVAISYSMVGGGGGMGGGAGFWGGGGGGGSSAILSGTNLIDVGAGGTGGDASPSISPGANGSTTSNVFVLGSGANLTVYVGGGGGAGGWVYGSGGGSGYFGGGGGQSYYAGGTMGGTGGTTTGGLGIEDATNGGSFFGGNGGPGDAVNGGDGGNAGAGGAGGEYWYGGGGGGGFGGGGGACGDDGSTLPTAGGSNGATAASVTTIPGGLGASSWVGSTTLPAAAGAGAAAQAGQGGNAGLVILQYVSPTGACLL